MSCSVNGTSIFLTRGDTAYITVEMFDAEGNPYVPESGDEIKFTLKKSYLSETPLIEKVLDNENLILEINPEDTKDLIMNRDYSYDIQLTKANGDVDTFITSSIFRVGEEIG